MAPQTVDHAGGRARRTAGAVLGGIGIVLASATAAWSVYTGVHDAVWTALPFTLAATALGALLAVLRPSNPVGWAFLGAGVLFAVGLFTEQYAAHGLVTHPGSLPGSALALWTQTWVYLPAITLLFVIVPLVFPDGRLPRPSWRAAVWAAAVWTPVGVALSAFAPTNVRIGGVDFINPLGLDLLAGMTWLTGWAPGLITVAVGVAAVVGLVSRFRRSAGEQRQQLKWLAYAMTIVAVAFCVDPLVAWAAPDVYPFVFPVVQVLPAGIVAAAFIAIVQYRLYDIDALINRTLVYIVTSVSLVAGYIGVVDWLGAGVGASASRGVALLATAVVAVVFAPVKDRIQRLANRLLYGERDDPHRALVLLGEGLETAPAPGDVLPTVARTVVDTLRVPYAAIEVRVGDRMVVAAEHGRTLPSRVPPGQDDDRTLDHAVRLPLIHAGSQVGRLTVQQRGPRARLSGADRRVLSELARQIGPAVHSVRLAADLQRSREQLVVAREEERRRVGRDLHDGLGPQLASLAMRLEACRDLIAVDPERAAEMLDALLAAASETVEDVRRVAHSLRPPVLDALGLVGALQAQTSRRGAVEVDLRVDPKLPDLPAAVEVAAFRITLEALHNVEAHAAATHCTVTLTCHDGAVVLTIRDDGVGLATDHRAGVGLSSMAERAAELGGTWDINTDTDGGTVVRAVLPCAPSRLASGHNATDSRPKSGVAVSKEPIPASIRGTGGS